MNLGKFLEKYGDGITLNANEIFVRASDSVDVDIYDLPILIEMEREFGVDGVIAFMSLIEKAEPISPGNRYHEAKQYLKGYELFEDRDVNKWDCKYVIDAVRNLK